MADNHKTDNKIQPELSPDEKEKMRKALLFHQAMRLELEQAQPKKNSSHWYDFLNSAFSISVVGALIVAYLGNLWKAGEEDRAAQRHFREIAFSRTVAIQEKKLELVSTFAERISSSEIAFYNTKARTLRIMKLQGDLKKQNRINSNIKADIKADIKSLEKERDYYRKIFLSRPTTEGQITQVEALFHDIQDLTEKLRISIKQTQNSETIEELQEHDAEVIDYTTQIQQKMGKELQGDVDKANQAILSATDPEHK